MQTAQMMKASSIWQGMGIILKHDANREKTTKYRNDLQIESTTKEKS